MLTNCLHISISSSLARTFQLTSSSAGRCMSCCLDLHNFCITVPSSSRKCLLCSLYVVQGTRKHSMPILVLSAMCFRIDTAVLHMPGTGGGPSTSPSPSIGSEAEGVAAQACRSQNPPIQAVCKPIPAEVCTFDMSSMFLVYVKPTPASYHNISLSWAMPRLLCVNHGHLHLSHTANVPLIICAATMLCQCVQSLFCTSSQHQSYIFSQSLEC